MLSAKRNMRAAKRFFRKMLKAPKHQSPRVINVYQSNAYPSAVEESRAVVSAVCPTSSSFPTVSEQLRASRHKSIAAGASRWSNVRLNPFLRGDYEEKNPDFRRRFLSGVHDVFARTGSDLWVPGRGRETRLGHHQRQHR